MTAVESAPPSGADVGAVVPDSDATRAAEEALADWPARLRAAVEQTVRARRARRDFHTDHRRRRDAGLRQRHAEKLRRADQRLAEAQRDGIDDSWHEEHQ